MPNIFISYRREDTSGDAGHLASDLCDRFGRDNVFIDIDAISGGADFEQRIQHALDRSRVTFVLIGDRWLTVTTQDGTRRLDGEHDYVRREIAAALAREDVAVVPVLVEGAKMPTAAQLPRDIAALATRNAVDLSNKRWRYDVRQLCRIAWQYDKWWQRLWRGLPRRYLVAVPIAAVTAIAAVTIVLATGGSSAGSSCGDVSRTVFYTSCPFAENVEKVYDAGPGGDTTISVFSPETGQDIRMHCMVVEGPRVHCTGGNKASVTFPRR